MSASRDLLKALFLDHLSTSIFLLPPYEIDRSESLFCT